MPKTRKHALGELARFQAGRRARRYDPAAADGPPVRIVGAESLSGGPGHGGFIDASRLRIAALDPEEPIAERHRLRADDVLIPLPLFGKHEVPPFPKLRIPKGTEPNPSPEPPAFCDHDHEAGRVAVLVTPEWEGRVFDASVLAIRMKGDALDPCLFREWFARDRFVPAAGLTRETLGEYPDPVPPRPRQETLSARLAAADEALAAALSAVAARRQFAGRMVMGEMFG